eukprot:sb/3475825/
MGSLRRDIGQTSSFDRAEGASRTKSSRMSVYDMLRNSYLSIYNGVMAVAHFYLLFMAILRVALGGQVYDMLRNSYLSIYNGVMAVAHFYLLFMAILRVALGGQGKILPVFRLSNDQKLQYKL